MKGFETPAWWKSPRERRLVVLAATIVGLYLVFAFAVRPAWRTLDSAPADLLKLDTQLQTMQRLASESRELRGAPPVSAVQAQAALRSASERLGPGAKLALQGDRAVLTLTNVSTTQLKGWLAEARSGARARPVEANLARAANGYSGTIVVVIPGGSS